MQNPNSGGDQDHQTHFKSPTSKRNTHRRRPVFKVQPGQIAFRLVCHTSVVGGLIGNSGTIVSQLRRETSCKIHCMDPISSTDDRVILVIGSVSPRKVIKLVGIAGDDDGCETELEVSNAQEAILRVFERVCELEAGKGSVGVSKAVNEEVWCKLLAHTSQIGAVVGKGGKHITTMRNNSGAKIRILPPPQCAAINEEMIQITGRTLAVKKALIAVSHCLQDCPPLDKAPTSSRMLTSSPPDRAPNDLEAENFPHLNSWLLPVQGKSQYDALDQTANTNGESRPGPKDKELEVVFRLLCSNRIAGSIIGKKGAIVRALESRTGASIIFAPPLSKFADRIVTISAVENLESSNSPAQEAVILVFARMIEDHIGKGFLSVATMKSPVTVRLLIAPCMVTCLNGNEGQVISELRELTGAEIQIMQGEEVSCVALDNDMVVEITGEYRCVKNALYKVTGIIRDDLFAKGKPSSPSGTLLPQNAKAGSISKNGKTRMHSYDDLEFGRGNELATVTNTTVEIAVSEHVFGSVYGEDGGNVDRIRQISGANVTVYDPCACESGGKVVISGTPDQTFAAQSLLQAFIQAGERTPRS
ncbi:KH domain-containing protein HEN4-like isoform X2 [Prosopis cineraria]|uniref:KH domain-containing protein HEN4-like isoform X2 n=1 Tax=Prosopis cineraria TaxID=364024 RepID=UPI00240F5B1D|nr:KH domain-containing protein HEN4-like isoform X2 [Prosopis cineraria]